MLSGSSLSPVLSSPASASCSLAAVSSSSFLVSASSVTSLQFFLSTTFPLVFYPSNFSLLAPSTAYPTSTTSFSSSSPSDPS